MDSLLWTPEHAPLYSETDEFEVKWTCLYQWLTHHSSSPSSLQLSGHDDKSHSFIILNPIVPGLQTCMSNQQTYPHLSCDVWVDPVFEVKYPSFPTTWILCTRSRFSWIFYAVGHMIVWYQWQCHLPIVILPSCLDNITYPLSHNNGCLMWRHGTVIWNVLIAVMGLLLLLLLL